MKRSVVGLLAVAFVVADVSMFAIAQSNPALRRAAFQTSKQAAAAGEYADAVAILEPLAETGDELALYSIGVLYSAGGEGLPQDHAKAMSYYQKAAEKRHAASMRQIAVAHEKGLGVPANPSMALQWYENAANRGDALAQKVLGNRYAKGENVPKNGTVAYKWLSLASAGVFFDNDVQMREETKTELKTLVASLTPGDINTGEKLTREFSAK